MIESSLCRDGVNHEAASEFFPRPRLLSSVAALLLAALLPSGCASVPAKTSGGAGPATGPAVAPAPASAGAPAEGPALLPEERRLADPVQLTFGGENAEGYWSFDGRSISFQARKGEEHPCDQIYTMRPDGGDVRLVSNGRGACTCAYWYPDGSRILFSSTHLGGDACPPKPSYDKGYVWALYPEYDIFSVKPDGSDLIRLTDHPGYDAEATISKDGRVVFTSLRDGDLDLYVMNLDGSGLRRLTTDLGYDGGAFFSADGTKIVYRAFHPKTSEEIADYTALLAENLIRPSKLEIFVMNADGTDRRQVTRNGAANFCPFFFPDGRRIIYTSNVADPKGRNFDLWAVDVDGSNPERITYEPTFDGFPMFSPDGKWLVWGSNRKGSRPGETNLWRARWVP